MKSYVIKGDNYLQGNIEVSGSKNLALPLLSLVILMKKKTTLHNIPRIKDVEEFLKIYDYLNITYNWTNKNTLFVDSSNYKYKPLTIKEISTIRASYYLIGAMLNKEKKIQISYPGGCDFEKRPIDIHIDLFKDLGAEVIEKETLEFEFKELKSRKIKLKNISFGATINAILMALSLKEDIEIKNI